MRTMRHVIALACALVATTSLASANDFGDWSVNIGSAGFEEAGTPAGIQGLSKRFASLLKVMGAQRARGWHADLVALQEASAHDEPSMTWLDCGGAKLSAADCMARDLSKATKQRFIGKQSSWLGFVYNDSVFQAVGARGHAERQRVQRLGEVDMGKRRSVLGSLRAGREVERREPADPEVRRTRHRLVRVHGGVRGTGLVHETGSAG